MSQAFYGRGLRAAHKVLSTLGRCSRQWEFRSFNVSQIRALVLNTLQQRNLVSRCDVGVSK